MLTTHPTPLHTVGSFTVLQELDTVLFRDDSTISLHQVLHDGIVSRHLRAFLLDEVHAIVIDVRDLVRSLRAELPLALDRDLPGLICWTLRMHYSCAAEFKTTAMALLRAAAQVKADPVQRALFSPPVGAGQQLQAQA